MAHDHIEMSDLELDALLAKASRPQLPLGAKGRLLTAIAQDKILAEAPSNRSKLGWLAGLPLAASLAFGLYLGSAGVEGSVLPSFAQDLLAETVLDDTYSGIEDVEALTEESLS
jgi:hypothetical protein